MKKVTCALALVLLLALAFVLPALCEEMTLIAQNDALALHADLKTGEIALVDRSDGFVWRSNPGEDERAKGAHKMTLQSQIILQYATERGTALTAISKPDSVNGGGLSYELRDNGVAFTYQFKKQELEVSVIYELHADYLAVSIPVQGIKETGLNKLNAIDLLPAMGAGKEDSDGYLLVPDGSGALIRFDNGNTSISELVLPMYGSDNGIEAQLSIGGNTQMLRVNTQPARLPVFGVHQQNRGLVAMITQNDAKAAIKARVSNLTSYNYAYSSFRYRMTGSMMMLKKEFGDRVTGVSERDGLTGGSYTVRYYPLQEGKGTYADMAAAVRRYFTDECGMTGKVPKDNYPLYLETFGYLKKPKQFLGFPYTATVSLTTLSDIRAIAEKIGRPQIVVNYKQWVRGGVYEKLPQAAILEGKLGKTEEMAALNAKLESQGGGLYPTADLFNISKGGNGFNVYRDSVLSPVNSPQMQFMKNTAFNVVLTDVKSWYLLSPRKMAPFFDNFTHDYERRVGLNRIGFEAVGDMCYSDNGLEGFGRGNVPALVSGLLDAAKEKAGSLLIENGNAYAAVKADHIFLTPMTASGYDMEDEAVPFYQMVFHGAVYYGIDATNLSSTPESMLLKCLEYGASPTFTLVGQNHEELVYSRMNRYYSVRADDWVDDARRHHAALYEVLAPLSDRAITGHQIIQNGVRRTDYGDVSVYVNYTDVAVAADGLTVPANGYCVGGNKQ